MVNIGTGVSQAHQQLQDVLAKQMEQVSVLSCTYCCPAVLTSSVACVLWLSGTWYVRCRQFLFAVSHNPLTVTLYTTVGNQFATQVCGVVCRILCYIGSYVTRFIFARLWLSFLSDSWLGLVVSTCLFTIPCKHARCCPLANRNSLKEMLLDCWNSINFPFPIFAR